MTRFAAYLLAVALIAGAGACARTASTPPRDPDAGRWTVFAEMQKGPGNITVTPEGTVLTSTHQFYGHDARVVRVTSDGRLIPWPNEVISVFDPDNPNSLDSVLGIQADTEGIVWMLDNGMREGTTPKLVAWNTGTNRLDRVIQIPAPVSLPNSFLNDLAVDRTNNHIYIADPAQGGPSAIIVVNLETGESRRVLEGHESVEPEDIDLFIKGRPVEVLDEDGNATRPRVGINPIALGPNNEWLYYGPMHGNTMYRIRTEHLRNTEKTPERLAARVHRYAWKPICDGISIDDQGNIYITDLARNSVGVIRPDRSYAQIARHPQLSWPDAFSFGPDGKLYLVANQLHRSAVLNAGEDETEPPFLVIRMTPLAPGTTGR